MKKAASANPRATAESRSPQEVWDAYWYQPQSAAPLVRLQQILYVLVALWFLAQLCALSFWWNGDGFNSIQLASSVEGYTEGEFAARFRLSPLWATQSGTVIVVWCLLGVVLAGLGAFNYGGRIVRALAVLWVLSLVQRISWSGGLAEPYMLALTAYLAISRMSAGHDWSHCFSRRLIQVHTWLMFCEALASQLALDTWRQGEAVWWMASVGRSNLLTTTMLEGRPLVVNTLTHALTLSTVVAIGCLWPFARQPGKLRRRVGVAAGVVLATGYAMVTDQTLYGVLLGAGLLTWHVRDSST